MTSTFRIGLNVFHPTMSSEMVCRNIPLKIRFNRSIGDLRTTKSGKILGGHYKDTIVNFFVTESALPFCEDVFVEVIEKSLDLLPSDEISAIIQTGGECFYLIGIFSHENIMFNFDVSLLNKLAAKGVGVKFDFYGGEDIV